MQTLNARPLTLIPARPAKLLLIAMILCVIIAGGLIYFYKFSGQAVVNRPVISQVVLAEKYGLRVNLLAVTAAGGMVDLRLKILDGEKAKLLLQEKANFPQLLAGSPSVHLTSSSDFTSQDIQYEKDGVILLIYPNSGNAVKSGSAVTVLFGGTALEPIQAK